jgi:hypothetical protein
MTQVKPQYPENLDLDLCNSLLAGVSPEAQEKIKGTTYAQMVSELSKPGEAIVEKMTFDKFVTLTRAAVLMVNAGHGLDQAKRIAIYNKEDVQPAERYVLPTSQGLDQSLAALTPEKAHLLHMAIGLVGEGAEMLAAVLDHVFGGQLDVDNILEEGGDASFFIQGLLGPVGLSMQTAGFANMVKLLGKRYPKGYSDAAAQERADKEPGQ